MYEQTEQDALDWIREVNQKSPFVKNFERSDFEKFLLSNKTMSQWLADELTDDRFLKMTFQYDISRRLTPTTKPETQQHEWRL